MSKAATAKQQNMKNSNKKIKNLVHSAILKIRKLMLHLIKEIDFSVQYPIIHHKKFLFSTRTVDSILTLAQI